MPRFLLLARIILKNNANALLQLDKSKRKNKPITIVLLVVLVFFIFSMFMSFLSTFSIGSIDGNGNIVEMDMVYINNVLTLLIPYVFLILFVFLNTCVISCFFLSTDSSSFLHLPFKPYEIFLAKLVYCLIFSYIIEFLFLFPLSVAYCVAANPGIVSIINQIIYFLSFPLIPISFIFLYSFIFVKILNVKKRKDITVVILSIISVLAVVAVQTLFNGFIQTDIDSFDIEQLLKVKEMINDSVANMKGLRPIFEFISSGFIKNNFTGFLNTIAFLLISLCFVSISSLIANKFYERHLLDENTVNKSRRKKDKLEFKIESPNKTYLLKEWRMLYRSPNLLIQTIFPPLILIIVIGTTFAALYTDPEAASEFNAWYDIIKNVFNKTPSTLPLAAIALATLTCSTVMISSTSFSREGKNVCLLKHIPLDQAKQVRLKMLPGIFVSAIIDIFVIICTALIFRLDIGITILSTLVCLLMIVVSNYIMILLDLKNPFVDWSNEVAAVKQNKIAMLSMLALIGISGLAIGLIFVAINYNIPFIAILLPLIAVLIIIIVLFELHLNKKRHSLFEHLE